MADLSNVINKEALCEIHLHIKLTNNGMLIDGEWNKERFLGLLKCKLMRHDKIKSLSVCTKVQRDTSLNKSLHSIIHSGIYSECILLELERKGMPSHSIMKTIKYGLLNLFPEELKYFQDFGAKIQDTDMWMEKLDERLIWNLSVAGLIKEQCWAIVVHGLISQTKDILYRLLSSGIDVPGILNWPRQDKSVTPTVTRFLRKLGIDEDALRYIEENGIDDEVEDMLIDLGYNEYKEKETLKEQEILCECSLIILESHSILLEKKMDDAAFNNCAQYNVAACICNYNLNLLQKDKNSETLDRNNYLRQNVMVPLSWAISRTLKYQPSDPKHYIAYQLLRWKYGNVSQEEMHYAEQFVISATIMMDRRLLEECKKKEAFKRLNKAVKDIPCDVCLERQKLYRIKERCWKCIEVPMSTYNKDIF